MTLGINPLLNLLNKGRRKKSSSNRFSDQDILLISYPRSGNTWLRFLIANVLKSDGDEINFHNLHEYVPELGRNTEIIDSKNPPRIIKTHALHKDKFPRVVYLVRDGRDVYTSYYHYRQKQLEEGTSFSDFLRKEDHFPCRWGDHVKSWLDADKSHQDFLLIRYEDMLQNTEAQLKKILIFIGLDFTDKTIHQAVEDSHFQRMRKRDQTEGRKYNLTGTKDFVRKGKSGSWKSEFSREDIDFFKESDGDMLIRLGYEKDQSW